MTNALPTPDRPIFLVGLMGAGKTTIGRRLAVRLGLPFVDSDEEIERSASLTIPDMFDRFGEAGFRDAERSVLERLIGSEPRVIAGGGGAFIDEGTRSLILECCIAIWLDSDAATLAARVSLDGGRPLLAGKDPLPFLRDLAERRGPAYAEAHLRIRSDSEPPGQVVERIVEALAGLAR